MTREPSIIDVAPLTAERVEPFEGPRPYVATGAMTDSGIIDPEMVTFEERPSRADLQVRPGDVCIARMRSTEKCFVFGAGCEDLILSTGFAVFRPDRDQLDPAYLAHYLRTERFQQSKDRLCTGAVQPAITNTALGELTIPLPSVEEQKRIAAILDAADNLRTKRRQALTKLDTLTQAIFHDMFGDPFGPDTATVPLSDLAKIVMGQSPPGSSYNDRGEGTPLLNGPSEFGPEFPTAVQWTSVPTRLSETGDILFCVRGATAGRMNMADGTYCLGRGLAAIRTEPGQRAFLFRVLESYYPRFQSTGVGSTFINISKKDLTDLPIPAANPSSTSRFGEIQSEAAEFRAAVVSELRGFDLLFASLQQRAFRGEL